MRSIKQLLILPGVVLLSSLAATAPARGEAKLTFEPLYGVETRLVQYPEPARYVTGATYGARVLYGTTLLAGEAEYTTTVGRNDYPGQDLKVEDKAERASLGVRTTFPVSSFLGAYLRAGGRASQGESVITTNGVSETKENPLRVDPYAGAGLQLAFHQFFALNAGVTLIRNAEGKYDSQYALGLSARFGNR
jgi:hypothetical protein